MFLHPSQFIKFSENHVIITEEDYNILTKSVEAGILGDIEKGYKDLSHLLKVTTPIIRNGKVVMQTFYINPNKTKEEDLKKTYRNTSKPAEKYIPKITDTVRVESNVFKRGDLVELTLQDGTKTIGQFRDFVITDDKTGKRKALIRAEIKDRKTGELKSKTIERNVEDIVLMNKPEVTEEKITVLKQFNPDDFQVGDSVKITLRKKDENNPKVTMQEVDAVIVRKIPKGFEILLPNGDIVHRPSSTLRKTGEAEYKITADQEVILNKAIKAIKNSIHDKVNLIDILIKRQVTGWQHTVERLQGEIENDKNLQFNYYQVYKGNIPFEGILKA